MHPYRVFTLEQANRVLPRVIDVTAETRARLLANRAEAHRASDDTFDDEARAIVGSWANAILELGAQPKGLFTVDFRTSDPSVVWCWAPEESEISHRHFAWESFKDRVTIAEAQERWPCRN